MRVLRRVGLALAFVAAPAAGAPMGVGVEPVHVLALDVDADELDTVAKTMTNALRQRVLDGEEYTIGGQSPQLVLVAKDAKCAVGRLGKPSVEENERVFDAACLKRIAAQVGAKRFFWGFVYPEGGRPVVRLHFWQEGRADRVATLPYDPDARERVVGRLYRKLVTPEKVGDVTLSGAYEGELVVDGRPEGPYAPGVELTLSAGEHALEVRREGKAVARAKVEVVAGRALEARLAPVMAPVAVEPVGGFRDPPPAVTPAQSWKRTAGFVGLGLGAALLGAGVVSSLRVKGLGDDLDSERPFLAYRGGIAGHDDVCDGGDADAASSLPGSATAGRVRRVCSGAATLQVAQLVFYGAGALAVGAGAYLLATSPRSAVPPKAAAWSLRPWVGASGGGVGLGLTF